MQMDPPPPNQSTEPPFSLSSDLSLSIFTIMGCRQSKPNVATGNTVAKSKKSKSNAKRISTPETQRDDKSPGLMEAAPVAIEGGVAVMVNGKEGESNQSRDLDRETEGCVKEDEEEEEKDVLRSISRESPNHYFSSRKDDESVVDAVSVSLSADERSVYSSPPHEMAGKEVNVFSKETIEDDDAVVETKTETEKKISGLNFEVNHSIKFYFDRSNC